MGRVIFAVDVGGTWVRMGLFRCTEGRLDPVLQHRSPSEGWAGFEEDLAQFLALPEVQISLVAARERVAVIALAGPVGGNSGSDSGKGSVTRWGPGVFRDVSPLLGSLHFDRSILLNDMEAANHAVTSAPEGSFLPIDGDESPLPRSRFIHLRPGTGLGMGFFRDGRSFPSEGGSAPCAFDTMDSDEVAVAEHFLAGSGGLSPPYEAALCGDGLRAMSQALTGKALSPETLTAEWGKSETSDRVVGLFVRLLARAAQGAALTLMPETCFFSGTIVDAIPREAWQTFCVLFRGHDTQSRLLTRVRLSIVKVPDLVLRGAAFAGARALGLEVR